MARKQTAWKTKGMNRDLSVSAFNPEFAFENMNLRLSTNEGNTTMSWVNEKGTLPLTIDSISVYDREDGWEAIEDPTISGIPLGTAVLNHQLILFVHDTASTSIPDYIYKFVYAGNDTTKTHMKGYILYNGNLKFSTDYPIETLVSYESENVQKVYWTDNKNQPRLINIAADLEDIVYNDTSFDFVCELLLNETITVEKKLNANGMFAPGVIQYAFTYYHKNGQESNIFYTTPLYYISYSDRGASPEQKVVENAFKINIKNVDTNFEYLRIYSIQRTSLNGTPTCRRIQDIYIKDIQPVNGEVNASYLDTGTSGDTIDPTELLFKGGEEITAKTMEQKDNTLFLGNIKMKSHVVNLVNKTNFSLYSSSEYRTIYANNVSSGSYRYANQLTSYAVGTNSSKTDVSVPCAGFKYMDYYRCGVQFQDKTGRWSEPVFLRDVQVENHPYVDSNNPDIIHLPIIRGQLEDVLAEEAITKGYLRVRAVVVYPKINDRVTLCQGVVCPTMRTQRRAEFDKDLHAQSSWFFRPYLDESQEWITSRGTAAPYSGVDYGGTLPYLNILSSPEEARRVEIEGVYDTENQFGVNKYDLTFHSPDIEYDEALQAFNFTGLEYQQIGMAKFSATFSDIDIQTETPTISSSGSGFIHKSFVDSSAYGIIAGLFYDDFLVDDAEDKTIEKWSKQKCPVKWLIYPWNKNGSLNNDINRPADKGTASAILKKKVISNLRYADTIWDTSKYSEYQHPIQPYLFNSNEEFILKAGDKIYQGNIDVLLYPDSQSGVYFAFNSTRNVSGTWGVDTPFNSNINWRTWALNDDGEGHGIYQYEEGEWSNVDSDIGTGYTDLVLKKEGVRMKYKSTPHLFFSTGANIKWDEELSLPVLDIRRENVDPTTLFGGQSKDAFRENVWIPCGEPVRLDDRKDYEGNSVVEFDYSYGDTYYQRWDCLKTYPFTREDPNQIVEIGSFMLETRANIDGRYDRNRGQINNLNMSPVNFNLYNPVYSQLNNFFNYRITETDEDNSTEIYPNQVTWTTTKQSDSDVDPWTTITLASVMELDGNKGSLNKLVRFNDQLIAFQDTGISQILYNENIQISSADGVPIEIANSGKVQGKRYLSNSIGCSNKWALTTTPSGIYFIDSNDKGIYLFNGQLQNLSVTFGFNSWAKKNIPTTVSYTNKDITWEPLHFNDFVAYYDQRNQDVLFINNDTALAFSEKLGVFTSFYDYGKTPFLCNFEDTGIWIRTDINQQEYDECKLYRHNAGGYCSFFGTSKPYWMTLIGNPEPQMDKIFTNLEFRACVDGDGTVDQQTNKFTPTLPFNSLETWNEYQHGITTLSNKNGHAAMKHHTSDGDSSLKRKFRIWRCDIPRDNATAPENDTERNIYRKNKHPLDRMRNSWLYLKLLKSTGTNGRTEVHDVMMTYFG